MELLRWFTKSPLSEKQVAKAVKVITNPYTQPEVRMDELKRLTKEGSEIALAGVLKRFTANAQGHIADEEEKKWLENKLVELGDKAIEPLKSFIQQEERITHALRAFTQIVGAPAALEFCLATLDRYGPDNYRKSEAKLQLILHVSAHLTDISLLQRLAPYLQDHSDNVRLAILDLIDQKNPVDMDSTLNRYLGSLACEQPDTSPRLMQRAATLLARFEWPLITLQNDVSPAISEVFFLDKKKIVRQKSHPRL